MSDSDDLFGSDDGIEELLDLPDGSAAKLSPPKPAPAAAPSSVRSSVDELSARERALAEEEAALAAEEAALEAEEAAFAAQKARLAQPAPAPAPAPTPPRRAAALAASNTFNAEDLSSCSEGGTPGPSPSTVQENSGPTLRSAGALGRINRVNVLNGLARPRAG